MSVVTWGNRVTARKRVIKKRENRMKMWRSEVVVKSAARKKKIKSEPKKKRGRKRKRKEAKRKNSTGLGMHKTAQGGSSLMEHRGRG